MTRFRFFPLVLGCAAGLAHAAAPDAAAFFRDPQISHVQMSPKGGYVAMVNALPNGEAALAVRDSSDPQKVSVVIRSTANERITAVHWINENRIGFTVKNLRVEFDGNYDEMAADRDGANLAHLISGNWQHQAQSLGSNIKSSVLTADYAYYGVAHDGSDDILVEKYSWNNLDMAPDHSRLYRLNTRSRQLRPVLEGPQPEAALTWLTDSRDVSRIVRSRVKGRCIVSYRQDGDTAWSELENGACYENVRFTPLFFDGDDTLYVAAPYKGYSALFRYDLKARKLASEPLVDAPGFDYAGAPEIDHATHRLLGIHLQTDAGASFWFNPQMKADQARVDALLPGRTNILHCGQDCLNAPALLVASASDRQPTEYILYQRAGGKLTSLGSAYPDIDARQMGQRDFHRYTARDGRQIPVYVTQPAGKADGPRPAVVLVHGGPSVRGVYWEWDQEAQFLAARGYLVIQPEFRGSTGYGIDHFRAGWKQWGGTMQDDLTDAAQWAVKQGWADPRRIAIMGASYGGYATLMGLIKNPDTFRCGVEWAGVTDLHLMFTSAQSDASQESLHYSMRTLIGDPDKDAQLFSRNSPAGRAAELKQPLLMAHGAQDRRVPLEHADRFRNAVKAGNPHVESIIYPEEGHGWRHEDDRIDFWNKVDAFLDRYLKHGA